MKVLTKSLIKLSEENAVNNGIFSYAQLMKNAGLKAAEIINESYPVNGKKVAVVCGNGNNGGDGFVIAAQLNKYGANVTVMTACGKPQTDNAEFYFNELTGISVTDRLCNDYDIIVDAVFGIGFNRACDDVISNLFKKINSLNAVRISVDLPSGVYCDDGKVPCTAVNADMTISFIALKPCFFLPPASDYCGKVIVADIGVEAAGYNYLTSERPVLKKRTHNSHKGTYGTAALICGSYGMAGAAILAARASLRSGVGIAKAIICDKIYTAFTTSVPEAVTVPVLTGENGTFIGDDEKILSAIEGCNAVLIGCGMGNNPDTRLLVKNIISSVKVPIVIDADGINSLCSDIDIIRKTKAPVILTPHPGEMARLCGVTVDDIESNRIGYAKSFAEKYNCILVLKGANTIIASKNSDVYFNTTGNPGMATGGSGDLLSGIIVSLLAQKTDAFTAARNAVYIHGLAGDYAAARLGEISMLPGDIIEELHNVFCSVTGF